MDHRDWNLLVLAAASGEPLSPVQFQKALFLLSRGLPPEVLGGSLYNFEPYNYGPFDAAVYRDAALLAEESLATVNPARQGWTEYSATPEGIERARAIARQLDPRVSRYIKEVVDWTRSQSFSSLVRSIYDKFPDMKANSVFQD